MHHVSSVLCCMLMPIVLLSNGCAGNKQLYKPINNFNLDRYLGTWYEIARMPSWFEKDLVRVTATYSLRPDGKVKVLNQGYKPAPSNKHKTAVGKAKFAADAATGHLRVSFFGPFYADYVIIDLDTNYQYALVASNSYNYLWILSRTPVLDSARVAILLKKAEVLGFDITKLYRVPQE